jgi:predicted outer membrane protein
MRSFMKSYTAGALTCAVVVCGVPVVRGQSPATQPPAQREPVTAGAIVTGPTNNGPQANAPQSVEVPQAVTANKVATPGAMMGRGSDQTIATILAIGNQKEVAMARLAESKIQNPDVRNFAETLVRDHTQFLTKLTQFGGYAGFSGQEPASLRTGVNAGQPSPLTQSIAQTNVQSIAPPAQPAGQAQLQVGQQPQLLPGNQPMPMNRGQLDFVSIKRQIAQACIASAEKDLDAKKPFEAEMDYVGTQIVAHKEMLETMKVLRQYASAELQPVIDQGIQTTQTHLQHAEKLVKSLASDQSQRQQPTNANR